ncbi:MAG: hypothetical protein Q8N84_03670 [bacterium]|nr:hypothetical protein [bacterium]
MNAQSVFTVRITIIGRGSRAKPREGWKKEVRDVSATTISIVRSDLRLSEVVQDLIRKACAWAEGHQDGEQDAQKMERLLRIELESAVRHLVMGFFDYQKLSGGAASFPWEEDLQKATETIIGVFRERFFDIEKLYPRKTYKCLPEHVLPNLHDGLLTACQPWLK